MKLPTWFLEILKQNAISQDDNELHIDNKNYILSDGILRSKDLYTKNQEQTKDTFGFKWHQRETFESDASLKMMQEWSRERYQDAKKWVAEFDKPIVLDAGCGAAYTGLEYFREVIQDIRYLGADISNAVDVAKDRVSSVTSEYCFIQNDLTNLPFHENSIDIIFSEGVLHHTDSTENAIKSLAPLLKRNGLFMFYVYKKKGPIREFTDDYIREKLQILNPEQAWEAMKPLTALGEKLGELNLEIDVPQEIDLLDIPKGKINIQRLFYWHIFKAFYRDDYSFDEMNHINYDWYAPANAHRQTPEQVTDWCTEANIDILHKNIQPSGITIVARKKI